MTTLNITLPTWLLWIIIATLVTNTVLDIIKLIIERRLRRQREEGRS